MISSRNIEDLLPDVQTVCRAWLKDCKADGIEVRVYCTYRDGDEQDRLHSLGRTEKNTDARPTRPMGSIVTKAKAGESWHNFRRAWDAVPMVGGECAWMRNDLYDRMGAIATKHGIEWGGRWAKFPDRPHFQVTGGFSLAFLRATHPRGFV